MDVTNILTRVSTNKANINEFLAITIFPLTVFKTEQDILLILNDLKKLIKPEHFSSLDDILIKSDVDYLMDRAGFVYPINSIRINNKYEKSKNENIGSPQGLLEHFTNSLYYIHKKIHKETNDGSRPIRKIGNAMDFLDSMQINNPKEAVTDAAKTISRYDGYNGSNVKYKDVKEDIIKNIHKQKLENKQKTNNPTIEIIQTNAELEEKMIIDLTSELHEMFPEKEGLEISHTLNDSPSSVDKSDLNKKSLTTDDINKKRKIIGEMIGYRMLSEYNIHTETSTKEMGHYYLDFFKEQFNRLDDLDSKSQRNEVSVYITETLKKLKKKPGKNIFNINNVFDTNDFLRKVAKGFLLINRDVNDLSEFLINCNKIIKEKDFNLGLYKSEVNSIVKEVIEEQADVKLVVNQTDVQKLLTTKMNQKETENPVERVSRKIANGLTSAVGYVIDESIKIYKKIKP